MFVRRILVCFTVLLSVVAGCHRADANAPTPTEGAVAPPAAAAAAAPAAEGSAVAQAAGYADDRYPGLLFELLDATEKTRFVGLAEAELCPCTGTASSLDTCLQREDVCEMGLQVGAVMMRLVKEGAADTAIADEVQTFIANARRVWSFDLADVPFSGAESPRLVLTVFSDFECPHCRDLAGALKRLVETHPDTVRVYYKQFPLPNHANAAQAAVAALAAGRQGQFVAYHDLLFERQDTLHDVPDVAAFLRQLAVELGLNASRFDADVADEALRALVDRDRHEGFRAQINATPTLYIDGVKYMEAHTFEALNARVAAALATP